MATAPIESALAMLPRLQPKLSAKGFMNTPTFTKTTAVEQHMIPIIAAHTMTQACRDKRLSPSAGPIVVGIAISSTSDSLHLDLAYCMLSPDWPAHIALEVAYCMH